MQNSFVFQYPYLTEAAMLPIGFIGSGLTPGKIPLLRMRAPFCITPGGTESKSEGEKKDQLEGHKTEQLTDHHI